MPEEHLIMMIHPESHESCRGCELLKGVNFAQCLAGFQPRFEFQKTLRPPACVEAVAALERMQLYCSNWSQHS